jgi:alpha-1,2-mannosyltransferase
MPDQSLLSVIRNGTWATDTRLRAYFRLYLAMAVITLTVQLLSTMTRHTTGADFILFWAAGQQVLQGDPAAAYVPLQHEAAMRHVMPGAAPFGLPFFYPPPLLVLCGAVAMLPYLPALMLWCAPGPLALTACLRRAFPLPGSVPPPAMLPLALAPAGLVNILNGQTGFLTATCFAGAALLLPRRPYLAGGALGLLVIKPHFALVVPVILLASRLWRSVAGAALAAIVACVLSWAVLGTRTWRSFLDHEAMAGAVLTQGLAPTEKIPSLFGAARMLDFPVSLALMGQGALTIATLALVLVLGRRADPRATIALAAAAAPLCTPYLFDYDLVCLLVPIAWIVTRARDTGWMSYEKTTLFVAYSGPLLLCPLSAGLHLPIGPLVTGLPLLLLARRLLSASGNTTGRA